MAKWKQWLYRKFLPAYCRDKLLEENRALGDLVKSQAQEIAKLNAYIDGMEAALRHQKRITIRNEVNGT